MKEKPRKKIAALALALFILTPVLALASPALAELNVWGDNPEGNWNGEETLRTRTGLGNDDPRATAARVINVILGFLGIIAVILILIGGFKWMTAGGNEDKVGEAKKLITAGVIGLVIILAAYGIATFVLQALGEATGGEGF